MALAWLPAAAFAALIFTLSSFKGDELPSLEPLAFSFLPQWVQEHMDKVVHAGVYGALGVLALRAVAFGTALSSCAAALAAFALCAAYGVSDELHQLFVPGRACDFYDWLADLTGSLAGVAAGTLLFGLRRRA